MFNIIVDTVESSGYLGIFFLMLLENVFPPIPSELIMPLAGFIAARGDLNALLVVLAGTAGSIAGTLPWYYAGIKLSECRLEELADRHAWWSTVTAADIRHASDWFAKHGHAAVLGGRLVPAIRSIISVPAGVAGMPLRQFLLYSIAGSLLWTGILTAAGFLLNAKYGEVARYLDPATKGIIGLLLAMYLYRLVRQLARRKRPSPVHADCQPARSDAPGQDPGQDGNSPFDAAAGGKPAAGSKVRKK